MTESDCRSKMISLRLSAAEYEVLKTHYHSYGVRNISELARLALQRMMTESAVPQDDFAATLSDLGKRVRTLESRISFFLEREVGMP